MSPAEAWGIVLVVLILLGGAVIAVLLVWVLALLLRLVVDTLAGKLNASRTNTEQIMKGDGS